MFPMSDDVHEIECDEALTEVFSILGKRWSGLILGTLLQRPARFGELARAIGGITQSKLSTPPAQFPRAGAGPPGLGQMGRASPPAGRARGGELPTPGTVAGREPQRANAACEAPAACGWPA